MGTEYRVIFAGTILDGFDAETVKKTAATRLKASDEQIARLFSGRIAVLKKGLTTEMGERYITELRRIGMLVKLEAIPALSVAPSQPTALPVTPITVSDLEKTQLAAPDALARYLNDEPDLSSAPTLIVPRTKAAEALLQVQQRDPPDPANAPTMIVPRASQASSGATIVVEHNAGHLHGKQVETHRSHDPERTLIANAGALEAYLAANSVASPLGNMTSTDIGLVSNTHSDEPEPARPTAHEPTGSYRAANTGADAMKSIHEREIAPPSSSHPEDPVLPPRTPETSQLAAESSTPPGHQTPRPFQVRPGDTPAKDFAGYRDPEEENGPAVTGFAALSPRMQLVLATLGGAGLLALVFWLVR